MSRIRQKDKIAGGLTEEEKARMAEHSALWIKRAFRTEPIDRRKITEAILGLYAAAGLEKPRVVVVPSPLVMAFAYGASAAIWRLRRSVATKTPQHNAATASATNAATANATYNATYTATREATNDATYNATRDATYDATDDATYDATRDATYDATDIATNDATDIATYDATASATNTATYDATDIATHNATRNATYNATRVATYDATNDATNDATANATYTATSIATDIATDIATYDATDDATNDATNDATASAATACFRIAGKFGLECAQRWSICYQGGNMWSSWECYLTAFRDILGLELAVHDKYVHWEQAAIHGGFRVMHPQFCIVSDFPEFIRIDDRNRPHCINGPSHRWRDGWELFHWHGRRVDRSVIMDSVTVDRIDKEPNAEIRRILVERYGESR